VMLRISKITSDMISRPHIFLLQFYFNDRANQEIDV
jgi:hypothetical protein